MQYMPKRPLGLRLDEELLAQIDDARGDVPRTRWIERALESALGGSQPGGSLSSRPRGDTETSPAPPRASGLMMERQRRLNERR